MPFLLGLLLILVIFIGIFFFLIQSKKINFKNKKRILQAELAINIIITLILLIISGLGMTMYFIVFWLIISALCYYLYSNNILYIFPMYLLNFTTLDLRNIILKIFRGE